LEYNNTGQDTFNSDDVEKKQIAKKATTSSYKKYKVKSGDSLSVIARKYHTSISTIKRINHMKSDMIQIGQILKIP
jgi:LysM repeat protein